MEERGSLRLDPQGPDSWAVGGGGGGYRHMRCRVSGATEEPGNSVSPEGREGCVRERDSR